MENHDRTGLAKAMARMDRKGQKGAFEAWFLAEIDRIFTGPDRDGVRQGCTGRRSVG